jgi:hypothetical protein
MVLRCAQDGKRTTFNSMHGFSEEHETDDGTSQLQLEEANHHRDLRQQRTPYLVKPFLLVLFAIKVGRY